MIAFDILTGENMRLSWPSSRAGNRRILTDRQDEDAAPMAETPVLYDMPSSPGSISTNDAATLIASPDQTAGRIHYRTDQLDAISVASDDSNDSNDSDDEFEQRRQLLNDVIPYGLFGITLFDQIRL